MATVYVYVAFCPRSCKDEGYRSEISFNDALEKVKTHVRGQHPDHDPLWFETYPEAIVSDFSAYRQGETSQ